MPEKLLPYKRRFLSQNTVQCFCQQERCQLNSLGKTNEKNEINQACLKMRKTHELFIVFLMYSSELSSGILCPR